MKPINRGEPITARRLNAIQRAATKPIRGGGGVSVSEDNIGQSIRVKKDSGLPYRVSAQKFEVQSESTEYVTARKHNAAVDVTQTVDILVAKPVNMRDTTGYFATGDIVTAISGVRGKTGVSYTYTAGTAPDEITLTKDLDWEILATGGESIDYPFIYEATADQTGETITAEMVSADGTLSGTSETLNAYEDAYRVQSGDLLILTMDASGSLVAMPIHGQSANPYTIPAGDGTTADTTTWDVDDQPAGYDGVKVEAWSRTHWTGALGDPIIVYTREGRFDSLGNLVYVGPEVETNRVITQEPETGTEWTMCEYVSCTDNPLPDGDTDAAYTITIADMPTGLTAFDGTHNVTLIDNGGAGYYTPSGEFELSDNLSGGMVDLSGSTQTAGVIMAIRSAQTSIGGTYMLSRVDVYCWFACTSGATRAAAIFTAYSPLTSAAVDPSALTYDYLYDTNFTQCSDVDSLDFISSSATCSVADYGG